jgi:hypothetical protein
MQAMHFECAVVEPNRLVANINAPLIEQILELSQRKRIADVHHHREADYLRRRVEITEGILHCRRLKSLARRLKPIYSDNAVLDYRPMFPVTHLLDFAAKPP